MRIQRVTLKNDGAAQLVMVRERAPGASSYEVYFNIELEGEGVIRSFYQLDHAEAFLEMLHGTNDPSRLQA